MRDEQVAKEYAKALFEAAMEKNALDKVAEEFNMVIESLADPEFEQFFDSIQIDSDTKKTVFNKVFLHHISETMRNFFWVILDNGRESLLFAINNEFIGLVDNFRKRVVAKVITAVPLDNNLITKIKNKMAEATQREVEVEAVVDPNIYGGMVIYVDGQVIDASVKTRLNSLREQLVQTR